MYKVQYIFGLWVHLEGIHMRFVYEGHWVKVKVTGAKHKNPYSCNLKL